MSHHQKEAERLEVKVEDGKYTVIQESNGNFYALRYDQPWRTLVGDNLVLALAQDLSTARDELVEWKKSAFACDLYRADTAHETPALWEKAQTDAAIALLNARAERDEFQTQLGTLAQQFDALSNLICNASDTLRSRGFEAPTPFDERVIKLAQAYDALMAIAVAANSDAPIPNRLDDIEKAITDAQEKGIEIK